METIDIKNKKWTDDEFYKVRKEVLATWPTGSEVDLDEAIAYHKSLPEHKVFSNKLNKAMWQGPLYELYKIRRRSIFYF